MSTPKKPGKPADHEEKLIDEAVDETFPASDPISPDAGKDVARRVPEDEQEADLDDALDDTFPASDPVSITTPHRDRK